jgi:hypothetical protein
MEVGHAFKKKPEAHVPEQGFGRFDNLQMLTANVTEQNPPASFKLKSSLMYRIRHLAAIPTQGNRKPPTIFLGLTSQLALPPLFSSFQHCPLPMSFYWAKADFGFKDGEGAESSLDFIARAQSFLVRLAEHPARDIVAFSHGQVINAVAWLIERKPLGVDVREMADWRDYEIANHVPNCGGYLLSKDPDEGGWRVSR